MNKRPDRCEVCKHFRSVKLSRGGRCTLDEGSRWWWAPDDFCSRFEPLRTIIDTTAGPMVLDWSKLTVSKP